MRIINFSFSKNHHLLINKVKMEDETFNDMEFIKEEIDPLNLGSLSEDNGGPKDIKIKCEEREYIDEKEKFSPSVKSLKEEDFEGHSSEVKEEYEDIDIVKEEIPPFEDGALDEDCEVESADESKDDPLEGVSSFVDVHEIANTDCRIQSRKSSSVIPYKEVVDGHTTSDDLRDNLNKRDIKIRSVNHSSNGTFKCDICSKHFMAKSLLIRHIRIHTGEKPFECETCKRRFTQRNHLNDHLRIHSGEKPFECETCKKGFIRKDHLNQHLRIHSGEKPFICEICQKRFSQKFSFKIHLRIHSEGKPYECDICQKQFWEKRNLFSHLFVHSGERPFKCIVCKKGFTRKDTLKDHLRIHSEERSFECDVCKKKFSKKSKFNIHSRTHK